MDSLNAKLTPKQERFVAEYLANGLNATKAALSAGYSTSRAEMTGSDLTRNPKVAAAIAEKTKRVVTKLDISLERTLKEIGRLAFFDFRRLFEADGSVKLVSEVDDDTAAGVAGFEVTELFECEGAQKHAYGLLKKVKIADKGANLDKLMRYHAAYKDKVEHNVILNDMFDRMSATELEKYAATGEVPAWFRTTVGATSMTVRRRPDDEESKT